MILDMMEWKGWGEGFGDVGMLMMRMMVRLEERSALRI
jgi:hypothetical protein